jgi:hypothetical protein
MFQLQAAAAHYTVSGSGAESLGSAHHDFRMEVYQEQWVVGVQCILFRLLYLQPGNFVEEKANELW